MKQLKVYIIIFSLTLSTLHAQTQYKKHTIGITFNLNYNLQKDEVFSRVARKSSMYGIGLNYTYNTGSEMYRVELWANIGTLKTTPTETNNRGKELSAFLVFTNLYKIKSNNDQYGYWMGAKLKFDFDALIPDGPLRYGWDALASVNPTLKLDYNISSKLMINYETDINLIGILWRPNAQGFSLKTEEILETKGMLPAMFERSYFSSLHNTVKWSNNFKLNYFVKNNIVLQAIYDLNYTNITIPRKKRSLNNVFRIGIQHKF
jgi:hypothetical protein